MAHEQPVEQAIAMTLVNAFAYADNRMTGNRQELMEWGKRKASAPKEIREALFKAGFVIRPIEGKPELRVEIKDWNPEEGRYHREIKAEVDIPAALTLWGEIHASPRDCTKQYAEYAARNLAAVLTKHIEERVAELIFSEMMQKAEWSDDR